MLFYDSFGSPSIKNPNPLIFLHGFLGSRLDWMPLIEKLQNSYHCIALDLPAHGNSPYSNEVFLSLEKTLLSLSNIPPILIGYSLGGRLAFSYGNKHPEKIKSLIALSAHTGLSTLQEKEKRQLQDRVWQERLIELSSEDFLKLWYQQPVFSSLQKKPHLLETISKLRAYQNPKELAQLLEQVSLAKQPLYDHFLHASYFLFGEEDTAYSNLYASKPLHLKKKIEQSGHVVHLENPLACIEAIQCFSSESFA